VTSLRYDLNGPAKWAVRALWLSIVMECIFAYSSVVSIGFFDKLEAGKIAQNRVTAEAASIDDLVRLCSIGYFVVYALCVTLACIWLYRSSWNARQLQPTDGRMTPGWAVGWYFVPILSLWKPFTAMRETWNSSANPQEQLNRAAPGFVKVWWGLWIIDNLASQVSFKMSMRAVSIQDLRWIYYLDLTITPIAIACAYSFIQVIAKVTAAQSDRNAQFNTPVREGVIQ